MEFSFERSAKITAILLLVLAITQAAYTGLYIAQVDVPRMLLWGSEAFLFTVLAAFAGAALAETKAYRVGWAAIAFSAVLNVVQVGIGLTLFGPFREVAEQNEAFAPAATAIVAFSFMVYNAAKILLALAAIVFGMAKKNDGAKALGTITALVGVIAFVTNTLSMAMGRDFSGELPLAGASGVIATLLLAWCLMGVRKEH